MAITIQLFWFFIYCLPSSCSFRQADFCLILLFTIKSMVQAFLKVTSAPVNWVFFEGASINFFCIVLYLYSLQTGQFSCLGCVLAIIESYPLDWVLNAGRSEILVELFSFSQILPKIPSVVVRIVILWRHKVDMGQDCMVSVIPESD